MTVNEARLMRVLARWHRRLAFLVVAWLVWLAATGFLINHAPGWGLDRKPLAAGLQRLVYGIDAGSSPFCETAPATGDDCGDVFAALEWARGLLLLSAHSLYLLDGDGALLEQLPVAETGLSNLEAGVNTGPVIYLRGSGGVVETGPDLLAFRMLGLAEAAGLRDAPWQAASPAGAKVSWERFLLDLHAARFLGPLAVWFNDLAAGLILLLAVTGAWLGRVKRRANRR